MPQVRKTRDIGARVLIALLVTGALSMAAPPAAAAQAANDEVVAALVNEALNNNPALEAAVKRALAAEKAVSPAGVLPDPQLTLGAMNLPVNSFSFEQEPMTGKVVSLMQVVPWPGKLGLAKDMARDEAAAAGYQRDEVRNQVEAMVERAYFDLYAVDRSRETVEKNKVLMEQLVRAAETRYATGSGLQQDVLRAQVEFAKLEDDLIMWDQKRQAAAARLNALLGRPSASPFERTPAELSLSEPPEAAFSQEAVEAHRPLLLALKERLDKAEAAVRLAERDYWPNLAFGASYAQRDNLSNGTILHDFLSATVSLNVPLHRKSRLAARVAEKELDRAAVTADYRNALAGVMADVKSLEAELGRDRKRVELFEGGILIQARQSLESARAGYEVGKVDFLTLINSWMLVQNYELQYFSALADSRKARAALDFAAGAGPGNDDE
jgi:cobalt-zinc-cadmium efflux system outer membrane protein